MNFFSVVLAGAILSSSINAVAETKRPTTATKAKEDNRADPLNSLSAVQQRAANGDAIAQYDLGTRYLKGKDVKQDNAAALAWFQQAAEKNNAEAQFMLGGMYDEGLAVAQDFQTAAEWNLRAAEQGHAGALYNLGMLYIVGDGVPRDLIQAHMWFNLAAAKGNPAGVEGRKRCEAKMSQWQLGEAQALAREWQAKYK